MIKAKAQQTPDKPRVYSYIRFSNPAQKMGDSERRQVDRAKEWAKRKGYEFDESLKDDGRSAYTGANRRHGALGRFLDRVKQGEVSPGSILVVEKIDRLSRENVIDAIETIIFGLIKQGITIQTLGESETTYDRKALNGHAVYGLIGQIIEAHNSSALKSERIREARQTQREKARTEKRMMTNQCPNWLDITAENKTVAVPEAAETIRMLFDLKLEGMGKARLARKMNAEAPWMPRRRLKNKQWGPGKGWRASYIDKVLRNPAVIGEYQPHELIGGRNGKRVPIGDPIPGYFPVIVSREVFYAVQEKLKANKGTGGRKDKLRNLLSGLVRCAYCGSTMRRDNKGNRSTEKLICSDGDRGWQCKKFRMRYDECETAILENCPRLKPAQVLPNPDDKAKLRKSLNVRIQGAIWPIAGFGTTTDQSTKPVLAPLPPTK